MSEEQNNHLATPQDFKLAQELDREVHRVVLPKLGKAVLMRRPSPLWFIFRGQLPASLASRVAQANAGAPPNPPLKAPEDFQRVARWVVELLEEIMVQPRVSLSPGPGEIPPDLISDEDLNFMIRWAMGEVASDGGDASSAGDLARFRGD
ncbi:MAG TPA: hypothetical protein VKW70_08375 [Terriglobia bacterium]|nr:hypothetical protein [Terriglobia bacterium]